MLEIYYKRFGPHHQSRYNAGFEQDLKHISNLQRTEKKLENARSEASEQLEVMRLSL